MFVQICATRWNDMVRRHPAAPFLSCRREPSYRDSFAVSLDPANK
ncbi:hypothetical protein [Wolbachia endosymbiont of Nomada ferruginata]|nr:hypothetical protein [Wolbachia endosymbiont of Nomada ferruginata]